MLDAIASQVNGYPGLLLFCSASGIVVPVPEDVALLWSGMRVSSGDFQLLPTMVAALVGVQIRDVTAWGIGRVLGETLLERPWVRRLIGRRKLERAHRMVTGHGALAVLFGRFLVGFRAPVFLVAGAMGLPLREFVRWDLLGLVITVPAVIALGYEFGDPLLQGVRWTLAQTRLVLGVATAVGAIAWYRNRPARPLLPEADDGLEATSER